jgi:hypothetical protein
LPPARIRGRKDRSASLSVSLQEPIFHESEIMGLDKGNAPKVG